MKFIKLFLAVALIMLIFALALIPSAAAEIADLDTRRNKMSSNITYPEGIEFVKVHTAEARGHHFLLGASIIKYGDVWVCAYGQSLRAENDANSRFACKYSYDDCKTWSEEVEIAGPEGGYSRSHGVLFEYEGNLWAYCPKAAYNGGSVYPELVMEAYTLRDDMTWQAEGIVLNDAFWPLCEPIVLENGDVIMAGLECRGSGARPAVARSVAGNLAEWEMVIIPNSSNIDLWGETSVVDYGDRLVAFIRTNSGAVAVSESLDNGRTWSSLRLSDFEIANSKVYGGVLSTGSKYMIYNHGSRATMMISVGNTDGSYGFASPYLIRNGYVTEPAFLNNRQWAYPYAVEEDGKLYVVYAENKENCELAIIPVSSLSVKKDSGEDLPMYESAVEGQTIAMPEHRVLCELIDGEEDWWSGDGNGTANIRYGEIDGVPVVIRDQAISPASKNNQVLRKHFSVDLSEANLDRLAFVMTFYSDAGLSSSPSATNRIFWGNSMSKSGNDRPFSSDYSIVSRLDYRASSENLWAEVKPGWNTWIVSFRELGYTFHLADLNSFFIIFEDNKNVAYGDPLFALASVRIIELVEPEREEDPPSQTTALTTKPETQNKDEGGCGSKKGNDDALVGVSSGIGMAAVASVAAKQGSNKKKKRK